MGGKPKRSIKQIERLQDRKGKQERPEKKAKDAPETLRARAALVTPEVLDKVTKEAGSMRYVTPLLLSEKYNMKLSAAKSILKMLANRGVLQLVSKTRRVALYAAVSPAKV